MEKHKPTDPKPELDEIIERLEEIEQHMETLQDYTVRHVQKLYNADLDQQQAIIDTQKVLMGDLETRGIITRKEEPYQPLPAQGALSRMKNLRARAWGYAEEDDQSGEGSGSSSGGVQPQRLTKP